MMIDYRHSMVGGELLELPPGKVVCIGRNYAEHAQELNNPIPEEPLLFIKPATALASLSRPLRMPRDRGACHHELEVAALIGAPLTGADIDQARAGITHYGLALDLTLRDVQSALKAKGYPWEKAKAFDGSCPLSPWVPAGEFPDPQAIDFSLSINGVMRQQGNTRLMITPLFQLVSTISQYFTLLPGDSVLTGTPAGVGPLHSGDALLMTLAGRFRFAASVE